MPRPVKANHRQILLSEQWLHCPACQAPLYQSVYQRAWRICGHCGHHGRLPAKERIDLLSDGYQALDQPLQCQDPLHFVDSKPYPQRWQRAYKGQGEALCIGEASIGAQRFALATFDFAFIGGSMGIAVGQAWCDLLAHARRQKLPVVAVTASGGARMQEGVFALMQMAKVTAAIADLQAANLPYIVILTDPTTGGVSASLAALGDVILAEPGALVGFTGPRVIEQTVRQALPDGFQRAEFLWQHGMIDRVVHRRDLKQALSAWFCCLLEA